MASCKHCGGELLGTDLGDAPMTLITCPDCREAYRLVNTRDGVQVESAVPPQPLAGLVQRGSVMEGVLEHVDQFVEQLPTVPVATQRLMTAIHDPITTSADLARIIHEDATLSMRVLRLANSAVFSGREATSDLRLACARLGMRNIANVAQLVAHSQVYKSKNPIFAELMGQLWLHSVATARLVDSMGPVLAGLPVKQLFLSGLIHDVGKPVLLDVITNRYHGRTGELKKSWDVLIRALDQFSPYVGLRVAEHWGLAPEIRFTTFYMNMPGSAPRLHRQHAYLVALASATAETSGYGVAGDSGGKSRKLEVLIEEFTREANRESAERMADEAARSIVEYVDALAG
jgi:HD-like signal output (HDOD) protein